MMISWQTESDEIDQQWKLGYGYNQGPISYLISSDQQAALLVNMAKASILESETKPVWYYIVLNWLKLKGKLIIKLVCINF